MGFSSQPRPPLFKALPFRPVGTTYWCVLAHQPRIIVAKARALPRDLIFEAGLFAVVLQVRTARLGSARPPVGIGLDNKQT